MVTPKSIIIDVVNTSVKCIIGVGVKANSFVWCITHLCAEDSTNFKLICGIDEYLMAVLCTLVMNLNVMKQHKK